MKVLSGTSNTELVSFGSQEFAVRSVDTGVIGKAVSIHFQEFGGSRTWNVIEMVGLNQFGTATVVATFTGEGVAEYADGRGFVFTNYHYADDEPMCCASYYAINYFRPGAFGWTHSVRTVPRGHDFAEFKNQTSSPPTRSSERYRTTNDPTASRTMRLTQASSKG